MEAQGKELALMTELLCMELCVTMMTHVQQKFTLILEECTASIFSLPGLLFNPDLVCCFDYSLT
jgi:hypothetical protein